MTINMGKLDRALRAVAGLVLLIAAFTTAIGGDGWLNWIVIAAGAVLLGTAATGICPAYLPFGIRTCRSR